MTTSQVSTKPGGNEPSLKGWWALTRQAAKEWIADYAPSMGAALSYYTIFSLAPLLLIVISIAGLIFGADAAHGEIFGQLRSMMGDDAAKAVEGLLASVSKPSKGIAATVIGLAVLLVGATTVFGELQDSLDRIWRAPARETSGLWGLIRTRILSFGMILGIAFLLMVSLVLGAATAALGKWWGGVFGSWEVLAHAVNVVFSFAVTTAVFAMIYKIMPRVKVRWHDVWLGAAVTALLFTIGRFLISIYIGKSGIASGFGAAGSLVIVLVWVYYSAQIFLMGAEFTWVYARTFGSMQALARPAGAATAGAPAVPLRGDAQAATRDPKQASPAPLSSAKNTSAGADKPLSLKDLGGGIALLLALRYIAPRLLRRRQTNPANQWRPP